MAPRGVTMVALIVAGAALFHLYEVAYKASLTLGNAISSVGNRADSPNPRP